MVTHVDFWRICFILNDFKIVIKNSNSYNEYKETIKPTQIFGKVQFLVIIFNKSSF